MVFVLIMNYLYLILRKTHFILKRIKKRTLIIFNRLFFNLDKKYLKNKFLELGLKQGMNIYVHSSLSKFGYVQNGAKSVIIALDEIIGKGTIMMPTFTYVKKEFSLQDKCWTGNVAETFRKMPLIKIV